ncbi:hypothetical protein HCH_03009 [Hahella chejuensis KCTC 2396]|uniref:Uncharacterized protein n=1 Tax=Hahella chejuensis (strain KCTC 2396) TaxID=349521 RepID=Q2SHU7_HAHCH|nr:hypothetical protein [Hahella chejuensis]ABC29777.1 hypothetical protein HCH_03009 [Hahella chejuensis KCTC 2396]
MKTNIILSTLAFLGVASILFILCFLQYLFGSETTLLKISYADMTKSRVHMLIEGKRIWYILGDNRTIERPGFLLDYDLNSKALTLFGLEPDKLALDYANITSDHTLTAGYIMSRQAQDPDYLVCLSRTLQLEIEPYSWSTAQRCRRGSSEQPDGVPDADSSVEPVSYNALDTRGIDRISPTLFFKKPKNDGDSYQIIDASGQIIAERKSPTEEDMKRIVSADPSFNFDPNAPLSQMPVHHESRALGLLPSGEVLLAFDSIWSAKKSVVLIAWDLQANTTRLEKHIFYESLFTPSRFEAFQMDWWSRLKYFVWPERRPIVPLHAIPATTR